ncbi:type II secretion system F family protein [Clostridium estertheticum]|uniref:type II secretion system F family protein n=1 Tax=Clostridium estertheticum TaxID=238834 RepID=UPI001C0E0F4C|nr:hypothetical protein [Clostridium estertheticum]MBU3173292.1 hypothetical protein [Clostridium estertheticum]
MKYVYLILNIMLLITIVIFVYFSISYLIEQKIIGKIKKGFDNYVEEEQKRQMEIIKKKFYIQTNKKHRYTEYLRFLITKSTINNRFKIVTPLTMIIINVLTSIVFYSLSSLTLNIIYSNILIGAFGFVVPQLFLMVLTALKGNKVDKMLIDYMNLLINFLSVQNNIVYAIENSTKFIEEPLKTFSEQFLFEVNHGVPPYTALLGLGKKVENTQFKFLCKTLSLCNTTSGKYLMITTKAKDLYMKTYDKDMERKNEALKSSFGIVGMVAIGAATIYTLSFINPKLFIQLTTTTMGQLLTSYIVFSFIVVILIAVNSLSFDY